MLTSGRKNLPEVQTSSPCAEFCMGPAAEVCSYSQFAALSRPVSQAFSEVLRCLHPAKSRYIPFYLHCTHVNRLSKGTWKVYRITCRQDRISQRDIMSTSSATHEVGKHTSSLEQPLTLSNVGAKHPNLLNTHVTKQLGGSGDPVCKPVNAFFLMLAPSRRCKLEPENFILSICKGHCGEHWCRRWGECCCWQR